MQLREFYREMNRNVKGIKQSSWFNPREGLCGNLHNYWSYHRTRKNTEKEYINFQQVKNRMHDDFVDHYGCKLLPFNGVFMNVPSFSYERESNTVYKNPYRVKWIRDRV